MRRDGEVDPVGFGYHYAKGSEPAQINHRRLLQDSDEGSLLAAASSKPQKMKRHQLFKNAQSPVTHAPKSGMFDAHGRRWTTASSARTPNKRTNDS
jgi:hypothetical protein